MKDDLFWYKEEWNGTWYGVPRPDPTKEIEYWGWIPSRFKTYGTLRSLGVKGPMKYTFGKTAYGLGSWSHCHVTEKVLLVLTEKGLPNPNSFTAGYKGTDTQLSKPFQKYQIWPAIWSTDHGAKAFKPSELPEEILKMFKEWDPEKREVLKEMCNRFAREKGSM